MNKRLIRAGAISIVIAVVILITSIPIGMSMLGKGSVNNLLLVMAIYKYVGYALGAVGLVLLLAGLLSKSGK